MSPHDRPADASHVVRDITGYRRPQLDGVRTIAVSLVVAEHAGAMYTLQEPYPLFDAAASGVRLFFVLSGFLITGILLRARGSPQIWKTFYMRRVVRILPLAYVAIFVTWMIGVPFTPGWYIAQLANLKVALDGGFEPGIGHFWSLAAEEQFYLFWPAVIVLVPDRRLAQTMAFFILVAGMVRWGLVADDGRLAAYVLMPARLDSLAAGGLCALALHRDPTASGSTMRRAGLIALATFGAGWLLPAAGRAVVHEWALIAASAALVVFAAEDSSKGRLLAWRPLVYLGTISYGIYVWHPLIPFGVMSLQTHLGLAAWFPTGGIPKLLAMGSGAVAAAAVSWHFFEHPINRLKRFFPYPAERASREANMMAPVRDRGRFSSLGARGSRPL